MKEMILSITVVAFCLVSSSNFYAQKQEKQTSSQQDTKQTDSKNIFPSEVGTYYESEKSYIKLADCSSLISNRKEGVMSKEEEEKVKATIASADYPSFIFITKNSLALESLRLLRVSTIKFEFQIDFASGTGTIKTIGDSMKLTKAELVEGKKETYRVRVTNTLSPDKYFFISEYKEDSKPIIALYGCFTVKQDGK